MEMTSDWPVWLLLDEPLILIQSGFIIGKRIGRDSNDHLQVRHGDNHNPLPPRTQITSDELGLGVWISRLEESDFPYWLRTSRKSVRHFKHVYSICADTFVQLSFVKMTRRLGHNRRYTPVVTLHKVGLTVTWLQYWYQHEHPAESNGFQVKSFCLVSKSTAPEQQDVFILDAIKEYGREQPLPCVQHVPSKHSKRTYVAESTLRVSPQIKCGVVSTRLPI